MKMIKYVQPRRFGAAIELLSQDSPDEFDSILKRLGTKVNDVEAKRRLNKMRTLRKLRTCVGTDKMLRIEGRLRKLRPATEHQAPFNLT